MLRAELAPKEIIVPSKVRRFVEEKVKVEEASVLIDKVIDVNIDREVGLNSDHIIFRPSTDSR